MEREKDIETWLRRRIEHQSGMFLKFVSPGSGGVPDRICIMPDGRIIFCELKTAAGSLSKIQEYQIKKLIGMGQQCCIIYGMDGAREFLHDLNTRAINKMIYKGTL